MVNTHYAVKVLSHPAVMKTLRDMGCGFDLATNGEIDLAQSLGITPDMCIHTHPVKKIKDISYAIEFGI